MAVVVFIIVPGARYGRAWIVAGAGAVKNASCPYILRHRVWSDWAIFLNIFADLSLSNVLDERGCYCRAGLPGTGAMVLKKVKAR